MDIKPSRPTQTAILPSGQIALSTPANRAAPTNWQVNSLIEAVVLQKTIEGKLILDLKGIQVEVADPPPLNFEKGQRWLLQLVKQTPLPVFKLLHAIQSGTNNTQSIQQALRTVTPKQQPMPPFLANVDALQQQVKTGSSPLPRDVQQAIQNLYQQIPTQKELQNGTSEPQRLKEIMTRIAPVLESELASLSRNEPSVAQSHVRTQLLRLATILQNSIQTHSMPGKNASLADPVLTQATRTAGQSAVQANPVKPLAGYPLNTEPAAQSVRYTPQAQTQMQASQAILVKAQPDQIMMELMRQVEGVLARGQVQQLNSLHAEQQVRPMWAMELPLRSDQGIDLFDLRIERDKQQGEEYTEVMPWSITLAFDLHGLGPVRAVVSLRGDQISTRFWAEHPETNLLFNQHLDLLHSQLSHAGINVGKLECQCGTLPEATDNMDPVLLDEKA